MTAGGYCGQALVVDVGTGTSERLPLPDDLLRAYLGGAGLGTWLMHRLAPPGVDPLAPAAPLALPHSVPSPAQPRPRHPCPMQSCPLPCSAGWQAA